MFGLGVPELIVVLVLALIIFGPTKLPEVGSALGKTIREFKKSTNEIEKEVVKPIDDLKSEANSIDKEN
ncbi:TatA/E family protein of Tat protein translocase [Desulfitispora alkaliphila]|uniref:TatA/E family twin arginine-targeting protein translocase n=1 Tax=Desulfitispora alkaliphila TaxID=622674 RepID=UPI003D216C89